MAELTPFGIAVRKLRLDKGLKLLDMAEKIGVTPSFLSAIETGRKPIPGGFLTKISRSIPLSLEEISTLRKAIDRTRTEVRVNKKSEQDRELIAAFARRLDDVPAEIIDELRKIVMKSHSGEVPFRRKRKGIFVDPLSTSSIRAFAEKIRNIFVGENIIAFPIVEVLEWGLMKFDKEFVFDVQEASLLGADEGRVPIREKQLILREDVYVGACKRNPRDIFTTAHEFAHYLMHRNISFARTRDDHEKVYCDSEWQADTFAGTLLMSPRHARLFKNSSEMAAACGVSEVAARVMWDKYASEGVLDQQLVR